MRSQCWSRERERVRMPGGGGEGCHFLSSTTWCLARTGLISWIVGLVGGVDQDEVKFSWGVEVEASWDRRLTGGFAVWHSIRYVWGRRE